LRSIIIDQAGKEVSVPRTVWLLPELADADLSETIQWGSGAKLNRGPVFISREELASVMSGEPNAPSHSDSDLHAIAVKHIPGRPVGTAPKLRVAQDAIKALYPHGVPPRDILPSRTLIERAHVWIRENRPNYVLSNKRIDVGDDTILMAAGRKKGKERK
jgi:hypothetical protein